MTLLFFSKVCTVGGVEGFVGEGGERERDNILRALRATRPHTVGDMGDVIKSRGRWNVLGLGLHAACYTKRMRPSIIWEKNGGNLVLGIEGGAERALPRQRTLYYH